jgi:myo-inositol-1(or 4)-monophosphatase
MPFLKVAEEIAREAGALLLEMFENGVAFELKGEFDLVTKADKASEKLIVERLKAHFPEHGIVAEEGGGHESTSEYRWYVDPVDGTTNFAHGYPMWNVTLALEKGDEMIAGVIFDPTRNEMFRAGRGAGAYLNGRQIRVSGARRLEDSLVSTGFPTGNRAKNPNIHFYHQLAMSTHGVRRGGSAAIDLAYVACGRLEAFWEFGLKPWDLAAGRLLVQEAGGAVSDMVGQPHRIGSSAHLLTDNGLIHDEMLELFAETFRGEMRHPMPGLTRA